MKTETDRTNQTPEDVINELRALVAEAEKILAQAPGDDCEAALAALRERFQTAQDRLADLYAGAKQRVVAGAQRTDVAIRGHPYQSLAIALGVGVLAGVLLGRRYK